MRSCYRFVLVAISPLSTLSLIGLLHRLSLATRDIDSSSQIHFLPLLVDIYLYHCPKNVHLILSIHRFLPLPLSSSSTLCCLSCLLCLCISYYVHHTPTTHTTSTYLHHIHPNAHHSGCSPTLSIVVSSIDLHCTPPWYIYDRAFYYFTLLHIFSS